MTDIASVQIAASQGRRKLKLDPLWLALPAFVLLALFLILPTAQILSLSVLDKTCSFSGAAQNVSAPTVPVGLYPAFCGNAHAPITNTLCTSQDWR